MLTVFLLLVGLTPRADDVYRFPSLPLTTQAMAANCEYRKQVEYVAWMTINGPRSDRWWARHEEAVRRHAVWDKLDSAHRMHSHEARMMALVELWRMLGPVDYWLGRMPNPIPEQP